ncbi:TIGR03086 family metal-binding protein [Amycolatopsis sp. H20-H5]|uniref:TIGR03086 family metal-binding protein n=1 Tax=Amycolatopsis sp. H20-H5 TaxID=3046309 RepID=UPI002DBEC325|nr:TIGR03086 family metal-binding protein [Amycolatopsis sp. H20-H5]MEC3978687.1 TIGR03086 family metal-binding protein [Amycolatopsis sp. H20-H5]
MGDTFEGILDRFSAAGAGFDRLARWVRPDQWAAPTPCAEWDVRLLVNHMTRGNLGYARLLEGGTGAEFVRLRDVDALGDDPVGAYAKSVRVCAEAFAAPGALERVLDYPLGRVTGRQALAVRTTDSVIHTWDLARALGADERLEPDLVVWIDENLDEIYAGLPETPAALETTHRFFAAPEGPADPAASRQDRLLRRMGRSGTGG